MIRFYSLLAVAPVALFLAACGSSVSNPNGTEITKSEARELKGVDSEGEDICSNEGWYGDAVCDDFCIVDDPDCSVSNECPDANDPGVVYFAGPGEPCPEIGCGDGMTYFGSEDCGCGCIQAPDPTGCAADADCGAGQHCIFQDGTCGTNGALGYCVNAIDDIGCTADYNPVCGCDGVTYGNACSAAIEYASIAYAGECETNVSSCGGLGGAQCDSEHFCKYAIDEMCGAADQTGTCLPRPEACAEYYDPVCGCDGVTYGNECTANSAGTSVYAEGECP